MKKKYRLSVVDDSGLYAIIAVPAESFAAASKKAVQAGWSVIGQCENQEPEQSACPHEGRKTVADMTDRQMVRAISHGVVRGLVIWTLINIGVALIVVLCYFMYATA